MIICMILSMKSAHPAYGWMMLAQGGDSDVVVCLLAFI